ncbi:transcriptional regulator of arginine metabolism [Acetoanaerobium pronyense]|uniref:Arginine repressor n=1 Tax=Acetoanaerobium pronyense TaxID=1482736 RepID=A0ABS4KIK6_9FIRM|nr:arginine repressor [Acetoanaerobium pronyense]MBP2027594.1 transcriptional regulator of arginine metabolism [Acetoanaerobium pronyense]
MKQSRHSRIIEIIEQKEIDTQDELVYELGKAGIQVTQATISRDIKELKLVKVLGNNGNYKYAILKDSDKSSFDKLIRFVKDVLISIDYSGNIICLKTVDGAANLVAKVIDSLEEKEILGTIGGTDTVFVLMKNMDDIPVFVERFEKLL